MSDKRIYLLLIEKDRAEGDSLADWLSQSREISCDVKLAESTIQLITRMKLDQVCVAPGVGEENR